LQGEIDDITDFDSLRKVREYFTQIRVIYRKLKQNVEAMQRQIETDPRAASRLLNQSQEQPLKDTSAAVADGAG
jgi:hypothetical protein